MKANELMIGDYIMLNGNIYIIEEISKKGWVHLIYNDGSECLMELSSDYILDFITPIPITAEILEKNGFRKDLMYFYLNIDDEKLLEFYTHEKRLRLWFDGVDEWVKATIKDLLFQCQCKYVHQLQHALRLCGIEKEIEL